MLQYRNFMNGAFGVTYEQLQPKLSLSTGPSATKHGPNRMSWTSWCNKVLFSLLFWAMCDDVQLCNRCVREFLILARTWFSFGLTSKTGCDIDYPVTVQRSGRSARREGKKGIIDLHALHIRWAIYKRCHKHQSENRTIWPASKQKQIKIIFF
jgi:hypothetical protein